MLEHSSGQDCDMHPAPRPSLGTKVGLYAQPAAGGCLGGHLCGAAATQTTNADPQNSKQDSHSSFDTASVHMVPAAGSADRKHGSIPRFATGRMADWHNSAERRKARSPLLGPSGDVSRQAAVPRHVPERLCGLLRHMSVPVWLDEPFPMVGVQAESHPVAHSATFFSYLCTRPLFFVLFTQW